MNEPTTSAISTNNTDKKQLSNDSPTVHGQGQATMQQTNDSKKTRKTKTNAQINQDDPSAQIFQIMQEQVRNHLINCESGRELDILHKTLKPDYQTLWLKCMEVKKDLLLAFQRNYPFVRLEVFGSTVMGIAFRDSDFDFFIELSHEPLNAKPASIIGKAMHILRQSGNFTNFLPICHARVPILKCYHIRSGYQCDINFSDSYGILNSPIVARLLSFDGRIHVLATVLKYWTKVHECAGKNRISNYAIIWMLLFYLQQLPVPILPPILEFQMRVPPYPVNGYNFAFNDRLPNNTKNRNRCSELLLGFFKFYKDFNFDTKVICPLNGQAFLKADIFDKKLPEFYHYHSMLHLNKNLSPMQFNKCICIQDPFEITHSIPGVIATSEFQKILWKFEYAADIIEDELKSQGESTSLLLSIFDADKFNQHVQKKSQKLSVQTKQQAAIFMSHYISNSKGTLHIKPTDYHLSIVREILSKKTTLSNAKIDSQAIHQFWSEHIIQWIESMLQDLFVFKIENENESNKITNGTQSPSTSICDNDGNANKDGVLQEKMETFLKEFNIYGDRDVFLGRKLSKNITTDTLNAEIQESQKRYKSCSIEMHLKAKVKIIANTNRLDEVIVELHDHIKTKKNNSFKSFFTNFDQNLNNLLKIYLVQRCGSIKTE